MARLLSLIDSLPIMLVLVICATLGLAPVLPEPHIWEKLKMLAAGELTRPIDMFDLVFHGVPWVVLVVKLVRAR